MSQVDHLKIQRALKASRSLNDACPIDNVYLLRHLDEEIEDRRKRLLKGIYDSFTIAELVIARTNVSHETIWHRTILKVGQWLKKLLRTQ
jgi:hypothetical protein